MLSKALVIVLWISCCFVKVAQSQSDELIVQVQTGKLYLQHTVVAKENWYSVGRLYNESPKVIAAFNNLAMTKPLTIGQQLNIPLDAANFSQTGTKAATETLVPVYHVVQEKEWMYRVSVNHNKVPIPMLEKWNNVNKDQVKAGMHLIIGYLKVNTAQSALAKIGGKAPVPSAAAVSAPVVSGPAKSAPASTGVPAGVEPLEKTTTATEKTAAAGKTANPAFDRAAQDKALAEKAATERVAADKAAAEKAAAGKSAGDKAAADKAASGKSVADKNAGDKAAADRAIADKTAADKAAADKVTADKAAADKAVRDKAAATAATAATAHPVAPTGPAINFNGGYFKVDFVDGGKSFGGSGGVFKSTSGWQDGKYYALMNNVNVGTIVKVTVSGSNKAIYAKVLGQLPDMKESVGLSVRISSAAASELGQGDGRFNVDIRY